jgi:hypothetical protein
VGDAVEVCVRTPRFARIVARACQGFGVKIVVIPAPSLTSLMNVAPNAVQLLLQQLYKCVRNVATFGMVPIVRIVGIEPAGFG